MDSKDNRPVGRGGLKLKAALDRFDLGKVVRGSRAVDVGASTGGFTQVLLDSGATTVLCVDAGHDQLHESLRRDDRVRNLERTDWKRLSLADEAAAGPFDFFTVDVSFVAARNMLRGLAFRLRPGAQGVVLVKPQFELPDHLVRGGDVSDPGLRSQAVARFARKAEDLGFRILSHFDSPVAGGEGTVEILAHLVFDGRSDKLPRPGEKRPMNRVPRPGTDTRTENVVAGEAIGKAAGRVAVKKSSVTLVGPLDWFAVVTPGVEDVAVREAATLLGESNVKGVPGGLELRGSLEMGMRANLHLRIPTRLLLRIGTARAREFGKMRHLLARLPWGAFLPPAVPVRITVSATHCRLYHTGAIEETVRAAIGDHLRTAPEKPASPTVDGPLILVRGVDDGWTVSVDSSGERLHRRGWRTAGGEAPLRESLASAVLALAGWSPTEALYDPMCGAGTIPIEACTAALEIAPGLRRAFAFERWPATNSSWGDRWVLLRKAAEEAHRDSLPAPIFASDRDAAAINVARQNAERAGVEAHITIADRPLADARPPVDAGLFIANPPYGERLGRRSDLPGLYREIGGVVRHRFPGWRAAVVVPDARLASAFRLPLASSHPFVHGGLRVTLLRFAPTASRGATPT